ncbi:TetR/AcrR family transcriptional regulator [Pseudonocardia sp. NPDC049154]|uniref:TetR/AcrR family transcriptional regulator n=1 Tax=Pseudonocardia sp. NPDC049154 TaxID=3155501 RepID=UPI00340DF701
MTSQTTGQARLRRDTARTRDKLIAAAGALLAEQGPTFSLPELARGAGVSTATAYRHFTDVYEVFAEFFLRLADELVAELGAVPADVRGLDRFTRMSGRWVALAAGWGRAATQMRSPTGFLERVRTQEPVTSALHGVLAPVVRELVADGVCPEQDVDYAVLVWVTLFDERVVVDLLALGWSPAEVAAHLQRSVLGALGATATTTVPAWSPTDRPGR